MQKSIVESNFVKLIKSVPNTVLFFSVFCLFFGVGCSTTKTDSPNVPPSKKTESTDYDPKPGQVWVYKMDGSKSCGVKQGESLDSAAAELSKRGVTVFKRRKKHDGQMRMMVCGADTGMQNELQIDGQSLPIAGALGYRLLSEI